MSAERTLTYDELVDALADVGGDGGGACEFDPMRSGDPDHHGQEFAEAIWRSVEHDRQTIAEMLRSRGSRP